MMEALPERIREHYRVPRGPVIDVQVHGNHIAITRIHIQRVVPYKDRWAMGPRSWSLISSGRVLWPEKAQ